ncbi:MAG: tetratricopeptide repeat protein [bacterium]|nr:tetratricopeptide repeat protein [bacterium]
MNRLKLGLCFLLVALMPLNAMAFNYLSYHELDFQTFSLDMNYKQSEDETLGKDGLYADLGATFMFNYFGYGFAFIPFQILDIEFVQTLHNFYFKTPEMKIPWLNLPFDIEVGALNIGVDKKLFEEGFPMYFKDTYATYRLQLLPNYPLKIYHSVYTLKDEDTETQNGFGLSIENGGNSFYIELDREIVYTGMRFALSDYAVIDSHIMPSDIEEGEEPDGYYSNFGYGLNIVSPLGNRKAAPILPLDVDELSLHYMEKGLIGYYEQNYDTALFYYKKVIETYPNFVLAHNRIGACYFELGQYKNARKAFKKALSIEPLNEDAEMGIDRINDLPRYIRDRNIDRSML